MEHFLTHHPALKLEICTIEGDQDSQATLGQYLLLFLQVVNIDEERTTRQLWYAILFFLCKDYEGLEGENLQTALVHSFSFVRLNS